jgi:phage terminase large subunit-like protein
MPDSPPYIVDGKTDAERYLTDCLDGKIVACEKVKRFADIMLPRITDGYKQWHLDVDACLRPVRFTERFCRIPSGKKSSSPFIMEPYERMPVELAFGFVDDDGNRQIKEVLIQWARKSGKTSLLAALNLYMLMSDSDERLKECYNAASSEAQARLCYGATDAMVKMSPLLSKRIRRGMVQKRGVSGLNYDATNSYLCTISSNGKKLDGLNTYFAVYDELAICEDGGMIYDLLTESMAGEHQKSPQLWIISTENYVRDNIWDERKSYAIGWLEGRIQDDTILPLIYELDSRDEIFDESKWVKASPGMGVTKSFSYLRERCAKASQAPARMPSLLVKEFNLRSNAYASFLDVKDCVNTTPINFNEIGIPPYVVIGLDLAVKYDLCSCVCRWKVPGDDRIYEIAKFWVASDVINMETDAKQKDKLPYLLWSTQGQEMGDTVWHYVDIVEGDRVGIQPAIDFMHDLVNEGMYPYCIGYDPWRVSDLEQDYLKRLVGESHVLPVSPTMKSVSPLVREHELDLRAHKVICPNPCLHHNRTSVQVREDPQGNVQVQKKNLQPHQKIDGFMAELYSLAAYNKFKDQYLAAIDWKPPEGTGDEETTDPDHE